MVFGGKVQPIAYAVSRQNLRDSMRRIRRILKDSGQPDPEDIRETDPVLAAMRMFESHITDVRGALALESQDDVTRHEIRRAMQGAGQELQRLEDMFRRADGEFNTAQLKGVDEAKIAPLKERRAKLERAYEGAQRCMDEVRASINERAKLPSAQGGLGGPAVSEPYAASRAPTTDRMRRAMDVLTRGQAQMDAEDMGVDMSEYDTGLSLATAPETREQMQAITAQKAKIAQSLDRIEAGAKRLHQLTIDLSQELQQQNERLDGIETKMEETNTNMRRLNKIIAKINKSLRPINIVVNLCCCFLLLGLVGLLLYKLKVFKF
jgi:methyl-accepting chemotaxis protein